MSLWALDLSPLAPPSRHSYPCGAISSDLCLRLECFLCPTPSSKHDDHWRPDMTSFILYTDSRGAFTQATTDGKVNFVVRSHSEGGTSCTARGPEMPLRVQWLFAELYQLAAGSNGGLDLPTWPNHRVSCAPEKLVEFAPLHYCCLAWLPKPPFLSSYKIILIPPISQTPRLQP